MLQELYPDLFVLGLLLGISLLGVVYIRWERAKLDRRFPPRD